MKKNYDFIVSIEFKNIKGAKFATKQKYVGIMEGLDGYHIKRILKRDIKERFKGILNKIEEGAWDVILRGTK